jgi:hypothetical protein
MTREGYVADVRTAHAAHDAREYTQWLRLLTTSKGVTIRRTMNA